jgi:hypothetical protein
MPELDDIAPEDLPFELPDGFAETVKGWDIPIDQLPRAVETFKGLQTEEGQIEAFLTFGQQLGFGLKDMERLFDDEVAAVTSPVETPAPPAPTEAEIEERDRPLTRGELAAIREEIRNDVQGEFTQREAAQAEARNQYTFQVIGRWYNDNEITDPAAQAVIARLGEDIAHANGADTYDPAVAVWALEQGRAAYDGFVEGEAQKALARKAAIAQQQPTSIGGAGGSPTAGDGEEPFDYSAQKGAALQSAKARVRARMRASGEIE